MKMKMRLKIFFSFSENLLKPRTISPYTLHSFTPTRPNSQAISIPKNFVRVRDHGFDDCMDFEKKIRRVLRFRALILSQRNQTLPISKFESFARRLGYGKNEAGRFILKLPYLFEIYEHPIYRVLYCRMTRKALLQIEQEQKATAAQIHDAVTRLRKLIMMSNTGRLCLDDVRLARSAFGLPDDFEYSVIFKYPQFFRLIDDKETGVKYIEVVDRDPSLTVCTVDQVREREYREKGADAADIRFSFVLNFPPGFRLNKDYKIALWKWQRLPYWSPYEDVSGYDLRSLEAQMRMEKRAIATIHELLSLTVEKKISLEKIVQLREAMNLPKKLKPFLLRHQGIFYISTRGNQGTLHTIFLREAYRKGELIQPNDLYLARRKLSELILVNPKWVAREREMEYSRKQREADEMEQSSEDIVQNGIRSLGIGNNLDGYEDRNSESELDCSADTDITDEDVDCEIESESEDADDPHVTE